MKRLLLNRFWEPPLLRDQSLALGVLNVAAPPLLWGLFCGFLSAIGPGIFVTGVLLSLIGAFGAGRQHLAAATGACRGALVGASFGAAILAGHDLSGGGALLFQSPLLQIAFTATVAACIGALGGLTRSRKRERVGSSLATSSLAGTVVRGD